MARRIVPRLARGENGPREAEDAVQEAWLRLSGTAYGEVDDPTAWLTTVVARISLNMLRSRKKRSETHVAEPIIDRDDAASPEH